MGNFHAWLKLTLVDLSCLVYRKKRESNALGRVYSVRYIYYIILYVRIYIYTVASLNVDDGKKFGNRVGFSGLFISLYVLNYRIAFRNKSKILTTYSSLKEKIRNPRTCIYYNNTMTSMGLQKQLCIFANTFM